MNNMIKDNMPDNEIRILGGQDAHSSLREVNSPSDSGTVKKNRKKRKYLFLILLFVIAALAYLFSLGINRESPVMMEENDRISLDTPMSEQTVTETPMPGVMVSVSDTVMNDIPLRIIEPEGGKMELFVGELPKDDKTVVLAVQAADIRGDVDKPAGAFVYHGELMAKGHSKLGFCAIIKDKITIGRQRETPLFERALEEDGDFFRQYSIVSGGQLIEIPPKGKAIRRALCLTDGLIQIIETTDGESYHDFAQALVDLGIGEALTLVGGVGLMKYTTPNGKTTIEGQPFASGLMSENYIIWKK